MEDNNKKPFICFISGHLPNSKSKEAGQKIVYEHLKELSERYSIILISFANRIELNGIDKTLNELCIKVEIIPINFRTRVLSVIRNYKLPWYVGLRYNKNVMKIIDKEREIYKIELFWLEYLQMAQYAYVLKKKDERWFIVCHDIISQMYERQNFKFAGIKALLFFLDIQRVRFWEKRVLGFFDKVMVLSKKDRQLISEYNSNIEIIYPFIYFSSRNYKRKLSIVPQIIFFGAMNRNENEDAMVWFLKHIFPKIKAKIPETQLVILGANPTDKVTRLAQKFDKVHVTGFVETPDVFFEQAWFSIVPLRLGAGVKIKVLESAARSVPIVATNIGAEGIEMTEQDGLFIRDDPNAFVEVCLKLLSSKKEIELLSNNINTWFQYNYVPKMLNKIYLDNIIQENVTTGSSELWSRY